MAQLILTSMLVAAIAAVGTLAATSPPPPDAITPRAHVVLSLNGTFSSPEVIDFDCAQIYQDDFAASHEDIVDRVNDAISGGQMCTGHLVTAVSVDDRFTFMGNVVFITFSTYLIPDPATTIRGTEVCSYEVQGFLENHDNWRDPIIDGYSCPEVTFNPARFDFVSAEWSCF